jgi:hypothetical protein
MMTSASPGPLLRNCMGCGQTDDHPRHHAVQPDGSSAYFHLDCHARLDPPCEVCSRQVAGSSGATGSAMQAHIIRIHAGEGAA